MNQELADHIALLAAPVYAAMLVHYNATIGVQTAEGLAELRLAAIQQAIMLRRDAREMSFPR